jgi:hypothetical protein
MSSKRGSGPRPGSTTAPCGKANRGDKTAIELFLSGIRALALHALEGDRSRLATFLGCVGGGDRSKLRASNDRNLSEIKPPGTKPSLQRRSKSPLTIPCETRTAVCSIAFWCKVFLH